MLDFIRIACAVPPVQVANTQKNIDNICRQIADADAANVDLILFPELCITGYTCADLFFQQTLLQGAKKGLSRLLDYSKAYPRITAVVGLPLDIDGLLYNCAAVLRGGELLGLVPKTYIPNHREFGEKRWFASSKDLRRNAIELCALGLGAAASIPVGTDIAFRLGDGTVMAVEICEDLFASIPVSSCLALAGAQIVVNLAASNETVTKRAFRRDLVKHQSGALCCIYAFCSAGAGESTQDMVFSGHSLIAQNGKIVAENKNIIETESMLITDADLGVIAAARRESTTFRDAAANNVDMPLPLFGDAPEALRSDGSLQTVRKNPFVPDDPEMLAERCRTAFEIQVAGLKRRLETINSKAVIGISGGLDSTLALLVAAEAMRRLGRPVTDVHGITMPGFGTSDRTLENAMQLMALLGITAKEISIANAVTEHFANIEHDPSVRDATYENAQARERTQILMDYAGKVGGIVVGTGDLSELALGWCTYNADHMSMYNVNGSVPKTLIPHVIRYVAQLPAFQCAAQVLEDIVNTPISPELLPPDENGKISQQTEDIVGPYALHDFFLYYVVRRGFAPTKIYEIACRAFAGEYDAATVKKWLIVFYHRFFSQQFKRNCQPDGVKIGTLSLNPRGDWQMPSDAAAQLWLSEAEQL